MDSFGVVLSTARKKLALSQRQVAESVIKEDGGTISTQYLNDLEHDRRNPPSEHLLRQLAATLKLSPDYLTFLAGQLPDEIRRSQASPEQIDKAFLAFRKALETKQ